MNKWQRHFLRMALLQSTMSKDPDTRVGAVVVGPHKEVRTMGFNGFPRGIVDSPGRLADRELKLRYMVHAEVNAILNASLIGVSLKGCTLYLAATDDSGMVWGGPPCTRCSVDIIQAGVVSVVSMPRKPTASKWHADLTMAREMLAEARIEYNEMELGTSLD